MNNLKNFIKSFFSTIDEINRHKAVEILETEVEELEKIFSLILFGELVGFPSSPPHIYLQFLPFSENMLIKLPEMIADAEDPLGKLFSTFDIT